VAILPRGILRWRCHSRPSDGVPNQGTPMRRNAEDRDLSPFYTILWPCHIVFTHEWPLLYKQRRIHTLVSGNMFRDSRMLLSRTLATSALSLLARVLFGTDPQLLRICSTEIINEILHKEATCNALSVIICHNASFINQEWISIAH